MSCIYKFTLAIALITTSQVSLAAFPNDLYGFKVGDSLSATLSKLKSKYGKSVVLGQSSVVQRKCGLGFIGSNRDFKIDDSTEIHFSFYNFKLTGAYSTREISLSTQDEIQSYLNDLMRKYGQPLKVEKNEDGSFSGIYYKNAYMSADSQAVYFSIFDQNYEDAMEKISENCINQSIRNHLP